MHEQIFEKALGDLKDTKIGLFLSDHQFLEGILLAIKEDHVVIDVNERVFYIARQHIRALSKNAKDFHESSQVVPYLDKQRLTDLLNFFRYNWVTINGSGNQALFGVLRTVSEDHIILINNAELLYIPTSCISNIHSEIAQDQIIKENTRQQLTIQSNSTVAVGEKIDEIDMQHLETIKESVPQLVDNTKELTAPSIEIEMQEVEHEVKVEAIPPQFEPVGKLELSSGDGEAAPQTDSSKAEGNLEFVSRLDNESTETFAFTQEEEIQDVQQVVHLEKLMEQLNELNLTGLFFQDEAETSEVDHLEVMGSTPNESSEELFTFTEPLDYERSFLLTDWRNKLKSKQALTSLYNLTEEKECPEHDGQSIEMNYCLEEIEAMHHPVREHHPISEIENCGQSGLVSEEPEPSAITNETLTVRNMSPKEEKSMLEKQFFSLMKHAAGNSYQVEEHSERQKSLSQPVSEWQYVSLMNHAAKMYQQLRDL